MSLPEYLESDEANAIFRVLVALLGKQKIPPNIINLNLLYEYVSETNSNLVNELKPYIYSYNRNYYYYEKNPNLGCSRSCCLFRELCFYDSNNTYRHK